MSLGNVIVIPGICGSELDYTTPQLTAANVWCNVLELGTQGPDKLQLAANGIDPGPLAGPPLHTSGYAPLGFYQSLRSRLTRDGWTTYFFAWDWRKRLQLAANDLLKFVQSVSPSSPFYFVTHSSGGLVARLCYNLISSVRPLSDVRKTIYLACPHGGSYSAVQCLANYQNLFGFWYLFFMYVGNAVPNFLSVIGNNPSLANRLRQVYSSWPCAYEVLPTPLAPYDTLDPLVPQILTAAPYLPTNAFISAPNLSIGTSTQATLAAQLLLPRPAEFNVISVATVTDYKLNDLVNIGNDAGYLDAVMGDGVIDTNRAKLPGVNTLELAGATHQGMVDYGPLLDQLTTLLLTATPPDSTIPDTGLKATVFLDTSGDNAKPSDMEILTAAVDP